MEELLIEKVRVHAALYDMKSPNYRDQRIRQDAWEEISRDLKMKAETTKDLWDKLRRCFLNAINRRRNKKSGRTTRNIPPWKHEQQMAFLLPFIDSRKTQGNIHEENYQDNQDCDEFDNAHEPEININENSDNPEQSTTITLQEILTDKNDDISYRLNDIKKRRRDGCDSSSIEMKNVMKENAYLRKSRCDKRHQEMDETDMFFLSMAKMTKTLPLLEQAQIKLQLSNSVLQAQIIHQSQLHETRPPSTYSAST